MARTYHVIDSDGHILEPLTLWKDYLDPAYRDRAPKLVIDSSTANARRCFWWRSRCWAASRA